MNAPNPIRTAIETDRLPPRVWIYANYHCNLACAYCLTESSPRSKRRVLPADTMIEVARQAADLGFTELGVTGGEPFLRPELPETIAKMADLLPVTVLTNATQFVGDRIRATDPLVGRPVRLQISLDAPDPEPNDELRGPDNYAKVVDAIPRLIERGVPVRIATTVEPGRLGAADHERLCALHRSWGIDDEDHLVRPVLREGRADEVGLGERFERDQLPPELTIAAHGAFWSAFGPTVRGDVPDSHLLLTRTILPLDIPANVLLRLVEGDPLARMPRSASAEREARASRSTRRRRWPQPRGRRQVGTRPATQRRGSGREPAHERVEQRLTSRRVVRRGR